MTLAVGHDDDRKSEPQIPSHPVPVTLPLIWDGEVTRPLSTSL